MKMSQLVVRDTEIARETVKKLVEGARVPGSVTFLTTEEWVAYNNGMDMLTFDDDRTQFVKLGWFRRFLLRFKRRPQTQTVMQKEPQ